MSIPVRDFGRSPTGPATPRFSLESTLGTPDGSLLTPAAAMDYKYVLLSTPSTSNCKSTVIWNDANAAGFAWASGEYRCASYNHYYTPNSVTPDCIGTQSGGGPQNQYSAWGWRTARSRHPAGVNLMMADGSVQFILDVVDPTLWTAWSTRRRQDHAADQSLASGQRPPADRLADAVA